MLGKTTSLFFAIVALVGVRTAAADPVPYADNGQEPNDFGYGWNENRLATGIGVGLTLGGGISGFTDQTMRDNMSNTVNGLWDARLTIGTHTPLGIDIGYVGTAGTLQLPSGGTNGNLIGSAVEGDLRWNIFPHFAWDPYAFAGVGWQNYEVSGQAVAMPGLASSSNNIDFPMGVGMAFRDPSGWLVDVRGTFRAEPGSDLFYQANQGVHASTNQWAANAALGYEF
jgi:hypothetical protein